MDNSNEEQSSTNQPNPPNNNNAKIIGVIVLILLIGGLAFWLTNSKKTTDNSQIASENNNQQATPQPAGPTSLKELMASGSPQKCDVSYSQNNIQNNGTVYLANGKMRGDFYTVVSEANGQTQNSHMINDGTNIYTWIDNAGDGFKMSVASSQAMSASSTASNQNKSLDANAKYDYKCSSWGGDATMFIAPPNVNFKDMTSLMEQVKGESTEGPVPGSNSAAIKAQQCAACNNVQDSNSKAQCKAALGC